MKREFRVFDTHTHLGHARHSGRSVDTAEMLRRMDAHGVDRSLLIPFPVVEDERKEHDLIAAAVRAYPDRFRGAACLNPWSAGFHDELKRCVEELGFRTLKLQPQYHGLNPIAKRSEFYFEAAAQYKLVLLVHTGAGAPFALPSLYISPARRYRELPIILGHAGGGLYVGEAIVAAGVCPNIYVELSSLMPHHVLDVLSHVSSDRLMIGSDLPESVDIEIGKILGLEISDSQKQDILWNTGDGLLK